jgi:hypothetical protein
MQNVSFHNFGVYPGLPMRLLLFALILMTGCNRNLPNLKIPYQRGLAENPKREKVGLRLIEPSWICFRSINGKDEWIADPKRDSAAIKIVRHDMDGALLLETDSYPSGRYVELNDVRFEEEIALQYDYITGEMEIIYLGDDREIRSWIDDSKKDNAQCLKVISKVQSKWGKVSK